MSTAMEQPTLAAASSPTPGSAPTDALLRTLAFEVFYDGDCPLCVREINLLRRMDKQDRILFTDIAAKGFDAAAYGKDHETLMAEIHGRVPSEGGARLNWVVGVDVFRHLYSIVGFGWAVKATKLPGVRQLMDVGYRFFAKYRLPLTGRKCDAGACEV